MIVNALDKGDDVNYTPDGGEAYFNKYMGARAVYDVLAENGLLNEERFEKPTGKQLIETALLFGGELVDKEKIVDMVAHATFIIDRLYDNGNINSKSKQEIEDESSI